jgi:hypothetical protein
MPLGNVHHGGDREPFDLGRRIDAELRTRIEDAVDHVCLASMVNARQARGEAAPVPDNPHDRQEYMARVGAFLERLRAEIMRGLAQEERERLGPALERQADEIDAAIAIQVSLAKALPDYWQRFDAVRLGPGADLDVSRGEPRSLLDRLLGRG